MAKRMLPVFVAVLWASAAPAFQADLVPVRHGPVSEDLEGSVSITGEHGHIRVVVEGLNDEKAEPVDGTATIELRLRVEGRRRRVSLPVVLDTGDGTAEASLNLRPGARVAVRDVRLRTPNGRTVAMAGALLESFVSVTTTTLPLPAPDDCPGGLEACRAALGFAQEDLAGCIEELELCEELE
jgi:hypothetical protein